MSKYSKDATLEIQSTPDGGAQATFLVRSPDGRPLAYKSRMTAEEVAAIRQAISGWRQNVVRGDIDDVLPLFSTRDDDAPMEMRDRRPVDRDVVLAPSFLAPTSTPRDELLTPKFADPREKLMTPSFVRPGRGGLRDRHVRGIELMKRQRSAMRGDENPNDIEHCIEMPDGTLVPTRIVHCPRARQAVQGSSFSLEPPGAYEIAGSHIRSVLLGRIAGQMQADNQDQGMAPVHTLSARYVDDALHEEQMQLFSEGGPHALDEFYQDSVFGNVGNVRKGEIISLNELDVSNDELLRSRLIERKGFVPKPTAIKPDLKEGGPIEIPDVLGHRNWNDEEAELAHEERRLTPGEQMLVLQQREAGSVVGRDGRPKQFVKTRDRLKAKLVKQAYRKAVRRIARYKAWTKGHRIPSRDDLSFARAEAKRLLHKHGLPTSFHGVTTSGLGELVPSMVWGCCGVDDVGFDLYYMNPMSWFRSKEVNELYIAMKQAEGRKEEAEKFKKVSDEARKRWDEVNKIEQALQDDLRTIAQVKAAKPTRSLAQTEQEVKQQSRETPDARGSVGDVGSVWSWFFGKPEGKIIDTTEKRPGKVKLFYKGEEFWVDKSRRADLDELDRVVEERKKLKRDDVLTPSFAKGEPVFHVGVWWRPMVWFQKHVRGFCNDVRKVAPGKLPALPRGALQ